MWDRSVFTDFLPVRVWSGFLLGAVGVPLGLALAYIYGGGVELLGSDVFLKIDSYVYTAVLLVGGIGIGGSYYAYHRDVSSSLAVVVGMVYGLLFGLEDFLVYLVSASDSLPEKLKYLNDSLVGMVVKPLGFDEVTRMALFTSIIVMGVLSLAVVKVLHGLEEEFLGVQI